MKKYTSKQEYAAFYWDGSNVEALQEWLNKLGVNKHIEIKQRGASGITWNILKDNTHVGLLSLPPKAVIISTSIGIDVKLITPNLFHKFFVEVDE